MHNFLDKVTYSDGLDGPAGRNARKGRIGGMTNLTFQQRRGLTAGGFETTNEGKAWGGRLGGIIGGILNLSSETRKGGGLTKAGYETTKQGKSAGGSANQTSADRDGKKTAGGHETTKQGKSAGGSKGGSANLTSADRGGKKTAGGHETTSQGKSAGAKKTVDRLLKGPIVWHICKKCGDHYRKMEKSEDQRHANRICTSTCINGKKCKGCTLLPCGPDCKVGKSCPGNQLVQKIAG